MELTIDDDVKRVAEFMQSNLPAAKLVAAASSLAAIAPLLWGHFEPTSIAALRLKAPPLSAGRVEHTRRGAR
jgi:hypothetical protein